MLRRLDLRVDIGMDLQQLQEVVSGKELQGLVFGELE
jgi:hypothetical protein